MSFADPYLSNLYNLGQTTMNRFLVLASASAVNENLFAQALATAQTLKNLRTLGTMRLWQGQLNRVVNTLDSIVGLSSSLSTADLERINTRYRGISAFVGVLNRNLPNAPTIDPNKLNQGTTAVAAPDLISLLSNSFLEIAPSGVTSPSNIVTEATAMATAWVNFANSFPVTTLASAGSGINSAEIIGVASAQIGNYLASNKNPPPLGQISTPVLWNTLVAAPTIALLGDLVFSQISNNDIQSFLVWKYRLRNNINSLYALAASYRIRLLNSVQMARIQQGDTIQEFAARESGDRANWQAIVALNGLRSPYIVDSPQFFPTISSNGSIVVGSYNLTIPSGTIFTVGQAIRVNGAGNGGDLVATIVAVAPNQLTLSSPASTTQYNAAVTTVTTRDRSLAAPGDNLFLPNLSATKNSNIPPDYNLNVLGADLYFGRFGGDMPNWTGDFALTAGINNYMYALERRILTPRGSLYFHPEYGSLIPPLIGRIATGATYAAIQRYLQSDLLSDPRTQSVSGARVLNFQAATAAIAVEADVTPYGLSGNSSNINLVLQPPSR